jgi:hypothetical protein
MPRFVQLLTLTVFGSAGVAALAADPPAAPPTPTDPVTGEKFDPARSRFVGEWTGEVVKVAGGDMDGSVTLKVRQAVPRFTGRRQVMQPTFKDLELAMAKDVAVRVMKLPAAVDDNGKPRQRTADETKKLKGPGNLPGYAAQLDQVKTGAVVRVRLVQPKRPRDAKPGDPAPKPLVAMIEILGETGAKK